jgi:hypothetical protein
MDGDRQKGDPERPVVYAELNDRFHAFYRHSFRGIILGLRD